MIRRTTMVIALLAAHLAYGATESAMRRGFATDGLYDVGELDAVDLYSGNLTMQIPLGQVYRTGGTLEYQFKLAYNSNVWNFLEQTGANLVSNWFVEDFRYFGRLVPQESMGAEAIPASQFNAGLGWQVSFGKIIGGILPNDTRALVVRYIDESGAEHAFFTDLHGTTPSENLIGPGPFYTRDGTYLRMRRIENDLEIDLPNGVTKHFACSNCSTSSGLAAEWNLTWMADRFGNKLTINRNVPARPPAGSTWSWTFVETTPDPNGNDVVVRQHEAQFFVKRTYRPAGYAADITYELLLKSLKLAACCDAGAGGTPAEYKFTYLEDARIHRPRQSNWDGSSVVIPFDPNDGTVAMALLRDIELPAGGGKWKFRYFEDGNGGPPPPDLDLAATPYPVSDFSGRVERVNYPTGGGMRYEYERRGFLRVDCDPTKPMDRAERFLSVSRRQPVNASGAAVGRPWIYAGAAFHMPQKRDCKTDVICTGTGSACTYLPKEFTSIVVDPLMKATVSFFSTFLNTGSNGSKWTIAEYGLPISHAEEDAQQRPISSEVYDCSAANLTVADAFRRIVARNRAAGETATCGEPLRKTYVQFESSGTSCDPAALGSCTHVNRRVASQRMTFYDVCTTNGRTSQYCRAAAGTDGQGDRRSMTIVNTNFDGLGHFRVSTMTGDFAAQAGRTAADDTREEVTWYNPNGMPAADKPWLLETYSFTRRTQHGRSEYRQYQWAPNGFMTARRAVANTRPPTSTDPDGETQANDVLTTWTRSVVNDATAGTVVLIDEKSFGGDLQNNLPAGFTPPGLPEYWIQRRYRAGALARSEYLECSGTSATRPALLIEDNGVHSPSGLVRNSKDAWGSQTTYGYDVLGRFTSIARPGEVATIYTYPNLTLNPGLRVVGAAQTSAQSGKVQEDYEFDSLGRLTVSRATVDGAWGRKETVWGDHQLAESTSNVGTASASLHRTESVYDVFGRPLQIIPAGEHDKRITTTYYGGHREERSIHGVASGLASTATAVERTNRDVFGRTITAEEGIAGEGASYTYDMSDRLTRITAGSQTRSFTFDGRGFLVSESHPELASTNVEYARIDSRGNSRERNYRVGTSTALTPFDLQFSFDAAERITTVRQRTTGRVLKSFTYDRGKLNTAQRSTWTPDPLSTGREREYQTVQSFQYHADGRLKMKRTSVGSLSASVLYAYDDLGSVKLAEYLPFQPPCEPNRVCPAAGVHRKVTYDYTFGSLERICDGATSPAANCTGGRPFINSIGYHVNGVPTSIARSSGVRETQQVDRDYPRPSLMSASDPGLRIIWSTGAMRYDGRTNVKAVGSDRFAYDPSGRLIDASVGNAPAPNTGSSIRQTFSYDRWGNMSTMSTTAPGATAVAVSFTNGTSSTNRINASAFAASYDAAANLITWSDPRRPGYRMHQTFDPFNAVVHSWLDGPGQTREFGRVFVYTADDERVGVINYGLKETNAPRLRETWSIRGANGEVMRDFVREERFEAATNRWISHWSWGRDYIYRNRSLAVEIAGAPEVVRHMHLDHLGSVRAVSDGNGNVLESRKYLPFGEQIAAARSSSRMQFAGHERDDDGFDGSYGDVDYMHARYYSGVMGRFLSVDPAMGKVGSIQSWNRYAYAFNNPLSRIDPDGREPVKVCAAPQTKPLLVIGEGSTITEMRKMGGGKIALNGWSRQSTPLGQAADQAFYMTSKVVRGQVSGVVNVSQHPGQTIESLAAAGRVQYAAEQASLETLKAVGLLDKLGRVVRIGGAALSFTGNVIMAFDYAFKSTEDNKFCDRYMKTWNAEGKPIAERSSKEVKQYFACGGLM